MAVEFQDVLYADLVLAGVQLLNSTERFKEFATSVQTDIETALPPPLSLDPNDLGITQLVRLPRDRIIIQASASRSTVKREYPSDDRDLDRLAEVATCAISHTELDVAGQELQAFGFNVAMVYNQTSGMTATRYLAKRLFPSDLLEDSGMVLEGGGGKLHLWHSDRRWVVSIEPRLNDPNESRVFISINMHRDEQTIPDQYDITDSLKSVWEQARNIASLLDKRGD